MTCDRAVRPLSRPAARSGGLIACVVVIGVSVAGCGDDSSARQIVTMPSGSTTVAALPAITPLACDASTATAGETVTNGPGGHDSAVAVVADYHWAVITARDTARATDAVAAGNAMASPQLISQALNGFPPGTTYCLRLRQTRPDTVLFTLTYQPPAGGTAEYRLRASVTGAAGAVRMTGEVEQ